MTFEKPFEGETALEDAFELTEKLFHRSAVAMAALAEQMELGDIPSEMDVKKAAAALTSTAMLVMKERARVLEQRKRSSGAVGDFSFDANEVRAEIGRKLDRLRESRRAECVSDGT